MKNGVISVYDRVFRPAYIIKIISKLQQKKAVSNAYFRAFEAA